MKEKINKAVVSYNNEAVVNGSARLLPCCRKSHKSGFRELLLRSLFCSCVSSVCGISTGYIERLRSVFYREVLKELLLFQYKFSILFWPQFLRGRL